MNDDGRLLVLFAALGLAGAAVARGSRGVVRRRPVVWTPAPGDEVGGERWPYRNAHPDNWETPHKGVVLSYPQAEKQILWPIGRRSRAGKEGKKTILVRWSFGETFRESLEKLRPYDEDVAAWEKAREDARKERGSKGIVRRGRGISCEPDTVVERLMELDESTFWSALMTIGPQSLTTSQVRKIQSKLDVRPYATKQWKKVVWKLIQLSGGPRMASLAGPWSGVSVETRRVVATTVIGWIPEAKLEEIVCPLVLRFMGSKGVVRRRPEGRSGTYDDPRFNHFVVILDLADPRPTILDSGWEDDEDARLQKDRLLSETSDDERITVRTRESLLREGIDPSDDGRWRRSEVRRSLD